MPNCNLQPVAKKMASVLVTTCSYPFCWHRGLAIWEQNELWVYHSTPESRNEAGGNLVRERFEQFMNGRQLLREFPVHIDAGTAQKYYEEKKTDRWTVFNNCEDVISEMLTGQKGSSLRDMYLKVIGGAVLMYLLFRKREAVYVVPR